MRRNALLTMLALLLFAVQAVSQTRIQSPESVFGFKMGTDRKLIDWAQIATYFNALAENSPRVQLEELGRTTLDRPMLMAIISSGETIQNLGKYRDIQQQLARPFNLKDSIAEALVQEGKLVFLITLNIHSTEIAASQESVELAFELATSESAAVKKIRENIIVLLVPSLNPDGQDMVTKWYRKDVGTEFEGSRMPMKYHYYADHDNNRDWFFFNLVESQLVAKVLYHDWYPEIVMDQHQMGSRGARFFLPPYADPVNPNVAPSLLANVNTLGKHVVSDLHDQGFTGVVTGTIFNAFFEGTMSKTPLWHNRIGILTEAASARIATPIFFPKTSLRGMGQDLPQYRQQTNFLDPWPGGWWRLRDIIELEKAATYSMLDLAATYKNKYKRNFFKLNKRAIAEGEAGSPFAYVVPVAQWDPNNAVEVLRRLRFANIDVYQAETDFETGQGRFTAGAFVVPLAQPSRAYIKDLMEVQEYPNLREYPGGPPRQPYDVTAWTLPLQFGVEVAAIEKPFDVEMILVTDPTLNPIETAPDSGWIAVERRYSHSFKFVNQLLQTDIDVFQVSAHDADLPRGTFLLPLSTDKTKVIQSAARNFEVPLGATTRPAAEDIKKVASARVAIYQPWIPYAYDEGWLRLVFDDFGYEYSVLNNEDFKSRTKLKNNFDILILGSQNTSWLVNGKSEKNSEPKLGVPKVRKEFVGGIGKVGVERIAQFLHDGGTILFFGDACNFAIEELHLPASNALKSTKRTQYFAPGSLFEMKLDSRSPLTLGLPSHVSIYKNRAIALQLQMYDREIRETGYFGSRNLLESGWAVGEDRLHEKVGLAEIPVGKGQAILYAFRPQHRGQTYGTFKLIFNALYLVQTAKI